jgi:hypothetical protein
MQHDGTPGGSAAPEPTALISSVNPKGNSPPPRSLKATCCLSDSRGEPELGAAPGYRNQVGTRSQTDLAKARRNLAVMRRANNDRSADAWFAERERRLRGPLARVIEVLVSTDQYPRDLRQVTPFAGVLADEERRAIYRADTAA